MSTDEPPQIPRAIDKIGYRVILCGDHAEFEAEWAGKDPRQRPDWPLPSFDARDWAKAFIDAYEKSPGEDFLTEDTMLGWFANALMRGYDEGTMVSYGKTQRPSSEERSDTELPAANSLPDTNRDIP